MNSSPKLKQAADRIEFGGFGMPAAPGVNARRDTERRDRDMQRTDTHRTTSWHGFVLRSTLHGTARLKQRQWSSRGPNFRADARIAMSLCARSKAGGVATN